MPGAGKQWIARADAGKPPDCDTRLLGDGAGVVGCRSPCAARARAQDRLRRIVASHELSGSIVDSITRRMIRIFRHYIPRSLVILGAGESLIFLGAFYLGMRFGLVFDSTAEVMTEPLWAEGMIYVMSMLLVMATAGLYQRGLRDDGLGLILRVGAALMVGLVIIRVVTSMEPTPGIHAVAFGHVFAYSAVGVALFRLIVHRYADAALFKRRVVVLGTGELASQVERLRRRSDWRDVLLVGYVRVRGESPEVDARKVLHAKSSLLDLCREHDAEEIVVAIERSHPSFPLDDMLECKSSGVRVIELVDFFERVNGKINIDALEPAPMTFADGRVHAIVRGHLHRALDLVVSASVLAVAWPIMCLSAMAILIESGGRGPILYRQVRVGRHNRPFQMLKFRSMAIDAEEAGGARWASARDSRVTRVGALIRKLRIDELPQLINVVKGDMSVVGPRPERPEFVTELARRIPYYNLRHRVNPGITGWAQICYPYGASEQDAREKLQYDLYYIKNHSLFLDVMILIQTAQVVLWGKGAR